MKLSTIIESVNGKVATTKEFQEQDIEFGFASDLMSDVLTLDNPQGTFVLVTGLANLQLLRTAEMADIHHVIVARGKSITAEMIELADENNITVIETGFSVFRTAGVMYELGVKPIF